MMRSRFASVLAGGAAMLLAGGVALVFGVETKAAPSPAAAQIARGKHLVTLMVCSDCHTPLKMGKDGPEPDMTRYLSGHPADLKMPPAPSPSGPWIWSGAGTNTAFAGPWGISYAMNLTPEPNTGIGSWSEETFIKAIRAGKHMGVSRPIAPPMPWNSYRNASDSELKAVYAYLRSIPPIVNKVPDYEEPKGPPPATH